MAGDRAATTLGYSVPEQARLLFENGILQNRFLQGYLPDSADKAVDFISFEGSHAPSLPINWRFAESVSALKAYEATMINALLQKKYGVGPVQVKINTDHAQLFIMSSLLWLLSTDDAPLGAAAMKTPEGRKEIATCFPDWDKHNTSTLCRGAATNIYQTKDGRYFHLHGSMNPDATLESLGLPKDAQYASLQDAMVPIQAAVAKRTADEMQGLAEKHKEAGTICWSTDEYKQSEHGQANAHVNLFEIQAHPYPEQKQAWWPSTEHSSPTRPLAGLKVVDLTRVIAGPAISRGLAELGASVMRITAPHLTDLSPLHPDLNHGKWNACLDLRQECDRRTLRELILDADIFLQGYRPGVLDKYGFSEKDIVEMCRDRGRGIIYCGENCYGWQGPWMHRSGWQQISDANCGVSLEFGRAMGNDEPVTPVFPNSDYCTGISGVVGIITALLRRAEGGGSYTVRVSLNYYSQWLVDCCGVYPPDVWQKLWERSGSPVFRHYQSMQVMLPRVLQILQETSAATLFRPEFFTQYHVKTIKRDMRIVAPVLQFPNGEVKLGFDISTRTNGVDKPRWPSDLTVDIVS